MMMRRGGWRNGTAWMLLPVLLFVALLPRGYMPDMQAWQRGALSLTLCRVVETRGGKAEEAPAASHAIVPCPFGMLTGLSPEIEPTALYLPWRWDVAVLSSMTASVATVAVWIGGLGARGPPGA